LKDTPENIYTKLGHGMGEMENGKWKMPSRRRANVQELINSA